MTNRSTHAEDDLRRAHAILARLVVAMSDAYLPHFEVLDREVQRLDARRDLLARARAVAARDSDSKNTPEPNQGGDPFARLCATR